MISVSFVSPKGPVLRFLQAVCLLLALLVVLFFLRHSLTTFAQSFRLDFERQSFIELSRGETFVVARKLAALAKGNQINCVTATKNGIVFFEEKKGNCAAGFFRTEEKVVEANQGIEIAFTLRLQDELFYGFLLFVALQLALAAATFLAQWQAVRAENQRDLELAALARQVGHDIRSPLAVLTHFYRQQQEEGVAGKALDRLRELVDHLLGEKRITVAQGSLQKILQEAIAEKSLEFGEKVQIKMDFSDDPILPGDSFMWKRTFSNVLNNAIEASEPNVAVVSIDLQQKNHQWVLSIQDNGRGIPPHILPKIGQKGFSFAKGRGSGLGLSSAVDFIKSVGGDWEVHSQEGKGTRVSFSFPVNQNVILVEDDLALATLWKKAAEKKGIQLQHYAHPDELRRMLGEISATTTVYLDVEFAGDSAAAFRLGKDLKKRGFRVYLCTGYNPSHFQDLPWVAGVMGKEPPWP